jgi:DNA-binding transcriptional MerR regulator
MGGSTFTVGGLARRCAVTPSLLRFWEAEGLLPAVRRTASGYRVYDDAAEARVRFILRAQGLGLSLGEVRTLLEAADGGSGEPALRERLRHLVAHKLSETERRVSELTEFAQQLERVWVRLGESDRCDCSHLGSCSCLPPSVQAAGRRHLLRELTLVADGTCQCQTPGECQAAPASA